MPLHDVRSPQVYRVSRTFLRALFPFWRVCTAVALFGGFYLSRAQGLFDSSSPSTLSVLQKKSAVGLGYVGDEACNSCHQNKVDTYHHTAHALTSRTPSLTSVNGKFSSGANILRTINPDLYFIMEAGEQGFTQTAFIRTSPTEVLNRTERFDLVIGSGRKGQTYLFWDDNQLFQLPVSHWTEMDGWVNSPGYADGTANFDRPIPPRCLECHASRFESQGPPDNKYVKSSLVLGISCEKCHGPGGEHVARFHSKALPRSPVEMAIVNPARLSRNRQIDICALCHAGSGKPLVPSLSFVPGDKLAEFVAIPARAAGTRLDVHASQVQLLRKSRCFQSSTTMTCSTCHDVHTPQRDATTFVSRCISCHQIESCRVFPTLGHGIDQQCVNCHMPLQQTEKIISSLNGSTVQPKVRNHQIAIYPEISLP